MKKLSLSQLARLRATAVATPDDAAGVPLLGDRLAGCRDDERGEVWRAAATWSRNAAIASALVLVLVSPGSSGAASRKDTTPPTTPTGLTLVAATATGLSIGWQPSRDNQRVKGYDLYRDGVRVGAVTTTSALFSSLTCQRSYGLGVDAYDRAGKRSAIATITASTAPCPAQAGG